MKNWAWADTLPKSAPSGVTVGTGVVFARLEELCTILTSQYAFDAREYCGKEEDLYVSTEHKGGMNLKVTIMISQQWADITLHTCGPNLCESVLATFARCHQK